MSNNENWLRSARLGLAGLAVTGGLSISHDSEAASLRDTPLGPEASHLLYVPNVKNQEIELERTWASFSSDIVELRKEIGSVLSPGAVTFEGILEYDINTRDKFRRLNLIPLEREVQGNKDYRAKYPEATLDGLADQIYLDTESITNIRDVSRGVGASTRILPEEPPHNITTWYGDEMGKSLKMVPDEVRGQIDNLYMYHEKIPNLSTVLVESRSLLTIWDTYRHSKSYSDLEVTIPFNQLYDVLRMTKTHAYMPFDLETPTARQDYLTLVNTLNYLLQVTTNQGGRDRTYIDTKESVAAEIINRVVHEGFELAEPLVEMSVETANGTFGGKLYEEIGQMTAEGRLPERAAPGTFDPNKLHLPDGVTAISVLDHRINPQEMLGLNGEPGYIVRLLAFEKSPDGTVNILVPDQIQMTTSTGVAIDQKQIYAVSLDETDQRALFVPLSAFTEGNGLLDNGASINTTLRYGNVEKVSQLVWNWEGEVSSSQTAEHLFSPSYQDEEVQAAAKAEEIIVSPLHITGKVELGSSTPLVTPAHIAEIHSSQSRLTITGEVPLGSKTLFQPGDIATR